MAAHDVIVASPATGTGGIRSGPTTADLPTDATTAIDEALVAQGYVGEDGLTMTEGRSSDKIRAWGGDTVRTVQTEHDVTFSYVYLELTARTAAELHGDDNVTGNDSDLQIKIKSDPLPIKARVFDMRDGESRIRVVVPRCQITEVGETNFVHSNAAGREVTVEAYPDDDGVKAYIYITHPVDGAAPDGAGAMSTSSTTTKSTSK